MTEELEHWRKQAGKWRARALKAEQITRTFELVTGGGDLVGRVAALVGRCQNLEEAIRDAIAEVGDKWQTAQAKAAANLDALPDDLHYSERWIADTIQDALSAAGEAHKDLVEQARATGLDQSADMGLAWALNTAQQSGILGTIDLLTMRHRIPSDRRIACYWVVRELEATGKVTPGTLAPLPLDWLQEHVTGEGRGQNHATICEALNTAFDYKRSGNTQAGYAAKHDLSKSLIALWSSWLGQIRKHARQCPPDIVESVGGRAAKL